MHACGGDISTDAHAPALINWFAQLYSGYLLSLHHHIWDLKLIYLAVRRTLYARRARIVFFALFALRMRRVYARFGALRCRFSRIFVRMRWRTITL